MPFVNSGDRDRTLEVSKELFGCRTAFLYQSDPDNQHRLELQSKERFPSVNFFLSTLQDNQRDMCTRGWKFLVTFLMRKNFANSLKGTLDLLHILCDSHVSYFLAHYEHKH